MSESSPPSSVPTAAQALRQRQAERKRLMEQQAALRRQSSVLPTPTPPPQPQQQSPSAGASVPGTPGPSIALPVNPPPPPPPQHAPVPRPAQTVEPTPEPRTVSQAQYAFGKPALGKLEWAVGLPLNEVEINDGCENSQKDTHLRFINQHHEDIERYLAAGEDADMDDAMDMMKKIAQITVHPNLAFPLPASSSSATDEYWAQLHIRASSKFKFLHGLVTVLEEKSVKIGIIAEEAALIDMLEIFFRGLRISHKRCDRPTTLPPIPEDLIESSVSVFIVPSKNSGAVGNSCNIVIAMDSFFDVDEREVQQMRRDLIDPNKLAPVIRLVALNTIEHALLCADPTKDFFSPCIEAIKLLRNDAGYADEAYMSATKDAAGKVAHWIMNRCNGELEIPSLPPLSLYETKPPTQVSVPMSPDNGEKRKRRESLIMPLADPKKPKIEEEPAITHATNIMASQPTFLDGRLIPDFQPPPDDKASNPATPAVPSASPDHHHMDIDSDATESDDDIPLSTIRHSPANAPIEYARPVELPQPETLESLSKPVLIARLRTNIEKLNSFIAAHSRLTSRHETLRDTIIPLKAELQTANTALANTRLAFQRTVTEKHTLAETLKQTTALLQDARSALSTGTAPQQSLITLTTQNESLTAQLAAAKIKEEAKERELQFTREQYQQASNATFGMRKEIDALEKEVAVLRVKADERAVRLVEVRKREVDERKEEEMDGLRRMLKEREGRIQRLEEEKKNRMQGGRSGAGTRTGSVPRTRNSPAGSRAASPVGGRWQ